jgi:hypothetical protein
MVVEEMLPVEAAKEHSMLEHRHLVLDAVPVAPE